MAFRFGPVLAISAFLIVSLSSPVWADSIDDAEAKARGVPVQQIQLEKEQKKNADLQAKILDLQAKLKAAQADDAALKGQLEQLSAQVAKLTPAPPSESKTLPTVASSTQPLATPSAGDPNGAAVKAIQMFSNTVITLNASADTDIQKRQKWLSAEKDLDNVLAKNRITISYGISNVTFDQKTGTALIEISSATIKSNDGQIMDAALSEPHRLTIVADEASAGKISTKSLMTLEGSIRMGVLNKPAAEQPAYVAERELLQPAYASANGLSGVMPVGRLRDVFSISGGIMAGPLLLIRDNAVLQIDGTVRKLALPGADGGGARSGRGGRGG